MKTKVDNINLLVFCSVGSLPLQRVTTEQWIDKKSEFRHKLGTNLRFLTRQNKLPIFRIYRVFLPTFHSFL